MNKSKKCFQINITGVVQGVGFRPYVYRLAAETDVKGWVLNSSTGVLIEAEGAINNLEEFTSRLVHTPPPMSVIENCLVKDIELQGFTEFTIRQSNDIGDKTVLISPDISVCEDCKREVLDSGNRRYRYPFTNCTNCGPRFTIIKDVPYDRAMTTMAEFNMCADCRQEYEDPLNRRFHAQPNACPVCGPRAVLLNRQGYEINLQPAEALKKGYIIAVKGIGSFHLAADARKTDTIKALRSRKRRDSKPFAIMVRDMEAARKLCEIDLIAEQCLKSPQTPIVILPRKNDKDFPDYLVHPGINTLGIMLPYTPLHYLLFDNELEALIMTSANISDEPLIIDNREAFKKLGNIADLFLVHNREIYNSCDDSVVQIVQGKPQFIRRARGYVPQGIKIPVKEKPVLAMGGEMKNTFCLTRERQAFLSQHWGDLSHYGNYIRFCQGIERFKKMLVVEPQVIAHDLHPDYQTTIMAKQQIEVPSIGVQHHFAHMASAMSENGLQGDTLGVVCDGSGWGLDNAVWGFEIIQGEYKNFKRRGHLKYVPLPGGDLTAKRPYRMALVYLNEALGDQGIELAEQFLPHFTAGEKQMLVNQIKNKIQVVPTSSCGRLFDAVAAFLGVCSFNNYEGQAAMELEAAADVCGEGCYNYKLIKDGDIWLMDVLEMWCELVDDRKKKKTKSTMARKFHLTLVKMIDDVLIRLRSETGLNRVVLSGGVFHNQILLEYLCRDLTMMGFEVYHHHLVPPGDGGLCLGQAAIASEVNI